MQPVYIKLIFGSIVVAVAIFLLAHSIIHEYFAAKRRHLDHVLKLTKEEADE